MTVKIVGETFAEGILRHQLPKDSGRRPSSTPSSKTIEDDGILEEVWEATIGKSLGGTPQLALGSVPGSSAGR